MKIYQWIRNPVQFHDDFDSVIFHKTISFAHTIIIFYHVCLFLFLCYSYSIILRYLYRKNSNQIFKLCGLKVSVLFYIISSQLPPYFFYQKIPSFALIKKPFFLPFATFSFQSFRIVKNILSLGIFVLGFFYNLLVVLCKICKICSRS